MAAGECMMKKMAKKNSKKTKAKKKY